MNLFLLVLGGVNIFLGGLHLANTLSGDPSRSVWYIAAMLGVGATCVLLSRVK